MRQTCYHCLCSYANQKKHDLLDRVQAVSFLEYLLESDKAKCASSCFPDFCFSNRKACDLCSPENLSGDHRKHRGKCENSGFSPALQKDQFSLKISPENEKTNQKTGRRRILKMVHSARFELTTYCSGGNRNTLKKNLVCQKCFK